MNETGSFKIQEVLNVCNYETKKKIFDTIKNDVAEIIKDK